ncbi:hypothetical protein BKA69DRAFT_135809 [Paraphysoderma sedebokerense]|nr:hypothetical protein BKA69DRAFT_135809 [Paraphysoderma sedebokerense]
MNPSLPVNFPEEETFRQQIAMNVTRYKAAYQLLKDLKIEIEHLQHLLENARIKLQKDFEAWWIERTSSITEPTRRSGDHNLRRRTQDETTFNSTASNWQAPPHPLNLPKNDTSSSLSSCSSSLSASSSQTLCDSMSASPVIVDRKEVTSSLPDLKQSSTTSNISRPSSTRSTGNLTVDNHVQEFYMMKQRLQGAILGQKK